MSFEEFDQQISDAAEKHHPVYHEEAWGQMQRLLDEHMPEQRKKRRRAFLLLPLLFLLTAGGIYVFSTGNKKNNNRSAENNTAIAATENPSTKNTPSTNNNNTTSNATPEPNPVAAENNTPANNPVPATSNNISHSPETGTAISSQPENRPVSAPVSTNNNIRKNNKPHHNRLNSYENALAAELPVNATKREARKGRGNKRSMAATTVARENEQNREQEVTMPVTNLEKPVPVKETEKEPPVDVPVEQKTTQAEQETGKLPDNQLPVKATEQKNNIAKKTTPRKNAFGKNFAVTVSAGGDVSAVRFSEPGKKRWIAGAGLQYAINKRFTVRAGAYQTKKIYSAQPADYGAKISYTPPGYTLISVDGDCRVLEIPVSVQFNINPAGKYRFFVATGATSMFMNTETYQYNYKTAYGQNRSYPHSLKKENEHLFSSFDLSLGVERQIGNRLFFRAEPYLRLPLHTVGYGQIKLRSAGILFTTGIRPFAKK